MKVIFLYEKSAVDQWINPPYIPQVGDYVVLKNVPPHGKTFRVEQREFSETQVYITVDAWS